MHGFESHTSLPDTHTYLSFITCPLYLYLINMKNYFKTFTIYHNHICMRKETFAISFRLLIIKYLVSPFYYNHCACTPLSSLSNTAARTHVWVHYPLVLHVHTLEFTIHYCCTYTPLSSLSTTAARTLVWVHYPLVLHVHTLEFTIHYCCTYTPLSSLSTIVYK